MENAFQNHQAAQLAVCHTQTFINRKLRFPADRLDHQHIHKIDKRNTEQYQPNHQIRQHLIQPPRFKICRVFAAACNSYAPVHALLVGIQIGFKGSLPGRMNINCQLAVRLPRKQNVKLRHGQDICKMERCLYAV